MIVLRAAFAFLVLAQLAQLALLACAQTVQAGPFAVTQIAAFDTRNRTRFSNFALDPVTGSLLAVGVVSTGPPRLVLVTCTAPPSFDQCVTRTMVTGASSFSTEPLVLVDSVSPGGPYLNVVVRFTTNDGPLLIRCLTNGSACRAPIDLIARARALPVPINRQSVPWAVIEETRMRLFVSCLDTRLRPVLLNCTLTGSNCTAVLLDRNVTACRFCSDVRSMLGI